LKDRYGMRRNCLGSATCRLDDALKQSSKRDNDMNKAHADLLLRFGLLAAVVWVPRAQLKAQPQSTTQLAPIQRIDNSALPTSASYWLFTKCGPNSSWPPLPFIPTPIRHLDLPIFALGSNAFVIDDRSVDWAAIEAANQLDQSLRMLESEEGGGENTYGDYPVGSLWMALAMTNHQTYGHMAVITLSGTTNDGWYEILSKTSPTDPEWWSEGSFQALTNPVASQASVTAYSNATGVFLYARALTNGSGNTLPIYWQLENFGRTGLDPSSVLGGGAQSLLESYLQGTEPNLIQFFVTATNNYANASPVTVQLEIAAGVPFYQAVLVDSTNPAGATWTTFNSTNVTVDVGSVEGWHTVWIGLRGFSAYSHQTWVCKRLKLDHTPPQLAMLSPSGGVVTQPRIQLLGSCPEALSAIWYDISNATGSLPNQQVLILDQYHNTNTWEFTTNSFQAFDVELAGGTNLIALHASDLAGNHTVTNFVFTLDYSNETNPPSIHMVWPQDGAQIAGGSFTLRGWTDDPTATVWAQVGGSAGNARDFIGAVDRTAHFWVDGIRLSAGTNIVALSLTDAAGNSSTTNITVVQSTVQVTMNPVTPASQLWQQAVNVSGTISHPSYALWVNGVKAGVSGNGTWSATNVNVTEGGAAIFQMTTFSPEEQQPDGSYGN
jgi:hypothetical protein